MAHVRWCEGRRELGSIGEIYLDAITCSPPSAGRGGILDAGKASLGAVTRGADGAKVAAAWDAASSSTRPPEWQVAAENPQVRMLVRRISEAAEEAARLDAEIAALLAEEATYGCLLTVPGIGPRTASELGISVISGETSVDQSSMTGESLPVDKHVGDELMSGTVNRTGVIEMRAERAYGDSSLQRMVVLAEATDSSRAPIVRLADKWASWMVFIALGCAVAVWLLTGDFMRAVTVFVVFCPCAFVLAIPTAIAAAVGNLTKYGVLVRTGDAVERLAVIEKIDFDKTGTLTYGTPRVVACVGRG